jgi:hypothetical protein
VIVVTPIEPAREIANILAKHHIPINAMDIVFNRVKEEVARQVVRECGKDQEEFANY